MNEREIFTIALDKPNDIARNEYLDQACGDDQALRSRVETLLQAATDAGDFMEHAPPGLVLTIASDHPQAFGESLSDLSLDFLTPSTKPGCLGTLGQYEVVGLVGRGGCGLVLRAYDTKLSRIVAIKVMAPELASNPTAVKRFLREAQAAAAVRHDHVVTIHAIEETIHPPVIVMEYVDGVSLKDKVDQDGELETQEIIRIGMQIALGLVAAHAQGLVHRDIKPANILLENGCLRAQITDFGLARATDDVGMTQTGMIAGTPQYMSPEQSQGHAVDARSDLFSLGSVMYTLCTGRPAFRADSTVATLRSVCDDTPRSIRSVNPDIPAWLEQIVMRLLSKSPDDRFQSAKEVASLLNDCMLNSPSSNTKFDFAISTTSSLQSQFRAIRKRIPSNSWFVQLVLIQMVALIISLLFGLENETILPAGLIVGLGMGSSIAISAWRSRLRWTSVAFGLSSICFVLLLGAVIIAYGLTPDDKTSISVLLGLYVVSAIPWGIYEIRHLVNDRNRSDSIPRRLIFNRPFFLFLFALQLVAVATAGVAATLEVESLFMSALFPGVLLGGLLCVVAYVSGEHKESFFFAVSAPLITFLIGFAISIGDWNTLHHYLPDAIWIAKMITAYSAVAIPIGLLGFAKELNSISDKPREFRFGIRTALTVTAVIAIACAAAKPCLVFGAVGYTAGIIFASTVLAIALLLGQLIYAEKDRANNRRLVILSACTFIIQVCFMGFVAAYDRSTDYGYVRVRTREPVKLYGIHKQRRIRSNILQDGSTFMHFISGEVSLKVADRPDLTVVPSSGVLTRSQPLEVHVVPAKEAVDTNANISSR